MTNVRRYDLSLGVLRIQSLVNFSSVSVGLLDSLLKLDEGIIKLVLLKVIRALFPILQDLLVLII